MSADVRETGLPGVLSIHPVVHADPRGVLVKTHLRSAFAEAGLPTDFPEQFVSRSVRGVVRGLHHQLPPGEQAKVVTCLDGRIQDVVVDLRVGSPTYGEHTSVVLDSEEWVSLYVPVGFAHGYAVTSAGATVHYLASAEYVPGTDAGVRWDSAGIRWPDAAPQVSVRDAQLPALADYVSPFRA